MRGAAVLVVVAATARAVAAAAPPPRGLGLAALAALAAVTSATKTLRNFVYLFDQGATGGTRVCDENIPRLVIAKQHESVGEGLSQKQVATCGVLVPNLTRAAGGTASTVAEKNAPTSDFKSAARARRRARCSRSSSPSRRDNYCPGAIEASHI